MSNEFGNIEIKKNSKSKLVVNRLGDVYKILRVEPVVALELAVKADENLESLNSYRVDGQGRVGAELSNLYNIKWLEFDRDTYETPGYIFNWLNSRFNFNLDGCASEENKKTELFTSDFLNTDFDDTYRIFVNPPYSNVAPFLAKAKELKEKGHLVVFLLNADKSTKWYENHIHNVANEVIDIIGERLAFIHPITKEPMRGNSKGQMVVVFDPTMNDFITRNVSLNFIQDKFK